MRTVQDIMTATLCSIPRDTHVSEVAGILERERISGAPLVDEFNRMVGIISQTDIVHLDFVGGDPYEARASEIASPHVITIDQSASLRDAAAIMIREQVHRLVAMDGERRVGIISSFDFVALVSEGELGGQD